MPTKSRPTEDVVLILALVFRAGRTEVGLVDLIRGIAGMQVDGHIERFRTRQHGLEVGVIEELVPDVSVGQCAEETVFSNRAFQFVRSCLWAQQGQRGEGLEAARITSHRPLYQLPVETVGEVDPLLPSDICTDGVCAERI